MAALRRYLAAQAVVVLCAAAALAQTAADGGTGFTTTGPTGEVTGDKIQARNANPGNSNRLAIRGNDSATAAPSCDEQAATDFLMLDRDNTAGFDMTLCRGLTVFGEGNFGIEFYGEAGQNNTLRITDRPIAIEGSASFHLGVKRMSLNASGVGAVADLRLTKARGTQDVWPDTYEDVQFNEVLGRISFHGWKGGDYREGFKIEAHVASWPANAAGGTRVLWFTHDGTTYDRRMAINPDGQFGFGPAFVGGGGLPGSFNVHGRPGRVALAARGNGADVFRLENQAGQLRLSFNEAGTLRITELGGGGNLYVCVDNNGNLSALAACN